MRLHSAALVEPSAESWLALHAMHVDAKRAPTALEYVFTLHIVQSPPLVLPANSWNVPSEQFVHAAAASAANVPGAHSTHVALLCAPFCALAVPAGHLVQESSPLPPCDPYFPAAHCTHAVLSTSYLPATQNSQATRPPRVDPRGVCLPAGHRVHAEAPASE